MSSNPMHSSGEWVKSSYSGNGGANCVEWAPAHARAHGVVLVRDSKQTNRPPLTLSLQGWIGLVEYARNTHTWSAQSSQSLD
ncbi:DUF397 domain-containing protein [Streptomyces sp. CAU 1734]|uniref:DUF397 domain-containing protein n=1 Tax=Streptomyces sp. CAU 1734 TaxID=3140360 RepID=UPI00325FF7A7